MAHSGRAHEDAVASHRSPFEAGGRCASLPERASQSLAVRLSWRARPRAADVEQHHPQGARAPWVQAPNDRARVSRRSVYAPLRDELSTPAHRAAACPSGTKCGLGVIQPRDIPPGASPDDAGLGGSP